MNPLDFVLHFDKRHPRDMGSVEVEQFLSDLAVRGNVSASTQNQAKSALLFLYRDVLGQELDWLRNITQARVPQRLPIVLTEKEVHALLRQLSGLHLLMAQLLYGSGMRLMECVRLRVKDVDFDQRMIVVRGPNIRHPELLGPVIRHPEVRARSASLEGRRPARFHELTCTPGPHPSRLPSLARGSHLRMTVVGWW